MFQPGFKHCSPGLNTSYVTSLNLSFLSCKVGIKMVWGLNERLHVNPQGQGLVRARAQWRRWWWWWWQRCVFSWQVLFCTTHDSDTTPLGGARSLSGVTAAAGESQKQKNGDEREWWLEWEVWLALGAHSRAGSWAQLLELESQPY